MNTKNKKDQVTPIKDDEKKHFVIGIGASAGGLEAINELFDNMPKQSPFSFIVVQHLSPDYKSLMSELLAKHTHMKVSNAEDGMLVRPDNVYVIPSKKNMTIRSGRLRLIDKNPTSVPNAAIDIFFNSLAKEKKQDSVCVILSGTGSDGTKGAEAIKGAGGLVIVQDPSTAKFNGMPNSAISAGLADHILSPDLIASEIISYAQNGKIEERMNGISEKEEADIVNSIIALIKENTTHDFSYYKRQTITRRIYKRMAYLSILDLRQYLEHLAGDHEELEILRKDFLIGVTRFFRDAPAFELIKSNVLPELLRNKDPEEIVKLWSVACSTGEEAYSLAILLKEFMAENNLEFEVKIFATDVDSEAVEFAAKGKYPRQIEDDVSRERLENYFEENDACYVINRHIRKMVVFAQHDVIKDPPFSKIDLISCRNLLIYMKPVLQRKVLSTFHFSLNLGGYLFLGSSENASDLSNVLVDVSKKWNIYKTSKIAENFIFDAPLLPAGDNNLHKFKVNGIASSKKLLQNKMNEVFCETVVEELGIVAIFIDDNNNLIQASGNYKKFLELPDKEFNLNLMKLVAPEVSVALSVALRKASKINEKVTFKGVRIKKDKGSRLIDLVVKSFVSRNDITRKMTLVIFRDSDVQKKFTSKEEKDYDQQLQYDQYKELEYELKETKESLHALMEEMETANEELQSSNEELLSSNEELQSTNEELQSLNEELHTVNAEHQQKIKELIELNDDLNNYFRSTEIGQIFVDKNLLIRRYTPAVSKQINVISSDIGRPISHFSFNITGANLVEDIKDVIEHKTMIEKEVEVSQGQSYLMRINPYVKLDKKTDGAVVTFVDISTLKKLNDILSGVLNSSLNGISAFKKTLNEKGDINDFEWVLANDAFKKMFEKENEILIGESFLKTLPGMAKVGLFDQFVEVVREGRILYTEVAYEDVWYEVMGVKINHGIAVTFSDINEKKIAEQKMAAAYDDLKKAEESLKKLNSSLEKRIEERTKDLTKSEERFRLVSKATNDAVWDWDLATNKVWWNTAFKTLFGYENNKLETGIDFWHDRIHPHDKERVINSKQQVINSGKTQWSEEYRFMKDDGSYAYVYARGYVVHNEEGKPCRMLGSKVDLTNLKSVEEELRHSNDTLRKINHDLDSFIYTASHDLKSPIANLEGLIGLLKKQLNGNLKAKEEKLLEMIDASIVRFNNTIRGLTDITKVQKDVESNVTDIHFREIFELVTEEIGYMISESHPVFETDFEVETLQYNSAHIKSIFYNLISNAIKYRSDERPLQINIKTRKEKNCVLLSISDNGLGMSKDQQQKLFSMFKRFHTHVDGTGIGLYTIKRIIENNNGKIEVESKEGEGTTFNVFFACSSRRSYDKTRE